MHVAFFIITTLAASSSERAWQGLEWGVPMLIAERITPERVKAARERLTARFGQPRDETRASEQEWRKGPAAPSSRLRVVHGPSGWIAYEEHERGSAAGPAGVLGLAWGAAAADVEAHLRAAGYQTSTGAPKVDPCLMPSPPPDCEPDANVVVRFSKTGEEGSAKVHKKDGLTEISWSIGTASLEEGLARAVRIVALRGPAAGIEESTVTTWSDTIRWENRDSMSDIADAVNESLEDQAESRLHSAVALLVAISATFMALCNVKDGNIVQAMAQAQAQSVDQWSYYQAKGMKENLAEATLDQLTLQRDLAADPRHVALIDQKIASYRLQVKKYADEKAAIRKQAEDDQKQYDALNVHDDQFDLSEACLSVAIALFGVTALTKKRWLLAIASIFMFFGVLFGLAGFFGWALHPDFLARLLS